MRVLALFSSILLMFQFYSTAFGYASEKDEKVVHCPYEIYCSKDNDISSCIARGDSLQYWNKPEKNASGPNKKGIYYFRIAYGSADTSRNNICLYWIDNNHSVVITPKVESYFLFSSNKAYSWEAMNVPHTIKRSECETSDPILCPFIAKDGLLIHSYFGRKIYVYHKNGTFIESLSQAPYFFLTTEHIESLCEKTSPCTLSVSVGLGDDPRNSKSYHIGFVELDLAGNVLGFKYPSSSPKYCFVKDETFNTIKIVTNYPTK